MVVVVEGDSFESRYSKPIKLFRPKRPKQQTDCRETSSYPSNETSTTSRGPFSCKKTLELLEAEDESLAGRPFLLSFSLEKDNTKFIVVSNLT